MTETESATSFLGSLRDGQRRSGLSPIGVLIDNRLGDSDMSDVFRFCKEHGIVVVRTFPGNPKTNGIIEGNFSIFERFVGDLNVSGSTPEEIGRSIATLIIEVFTQLRNHSPRSARGGRTALDVEDGARHARGGYATPSNGSLIDLIGSKSAPKSDGSSSVKSAATSVS